MINNMNQQGFAPILVLLLLVAGIGLGAYFIQQQTNIIPHAEYSSADGEGCRDNPRLAPPPDDKFMSEADRSVYDYYWKADCSRTCVDFDHSTDCPASDLGGTNTRWCYGFKDAGYCLKLQIVKAGTREDVSNSSRFNESSGSKPAMVRTTGTGGAVSTAACSTDQTQKIANTYYDAKVAQRYARYTAIIHGAKEYCVQADLGVDGLIPLREDSPDGVVKGGRLYLCSGKNSNVGSLDLVWRVISDDGVHIQASSRPNPGNDISKVIEVMLDYLNKAEESLGLPKTQK